MDAPIVVEAMNPTAALPYPLDPLTSMPTRAAFCERVDAALALATLRGFSVAILYLDLEGLRSINSLHGRAMGDQMLQCIGLRLARAASDSAMVSRVGGDEFACLVLGLPDCSPLESLARRILAGLAEPARIGAFDLALESNIGIVFCSRGDTDANTMLRWAALAMYRARHDKTGYAFNNYQSAGDPAPLFRMSSRPP